MGRIIHISILFIAATQCLEAAVPTITLKNSAVSGVEMPAMGLGMGGYGTKKSVGYGGYPECWAELPGCGEFTERAVKEWLDAGGRRLDSANMYLNEKSVGKAIKASSVPRSDIFITSKVGPVYALGYNETLNQFKQILANLQTDYVDLLLIHWPSALPPYPATTDPFCRHNSPTYDEKKCRLSTWEAMLVIFKSGAAKAIGVSNYENSHIQEIIDAKKPLPSVNQCHFNPYGGSSQMDKVNFCKAHDIVYLGYSPLGIPDWHKFPKPMESTPLRDPTVLEIAAAHKRSAAEVILAWEWSLGIPVNPRCMNATHMIQNLNIYDIVITKDESDKIMSCHQDTCLEDPNYYECFNTSNPYIY